LIPAYIFILWKTTKLLKKDIVCLEKVIENEGGRRRRRDIFG